MVEPKEIREMLKIALQEHMVSDHAGISGTEVAALFDEFETMSLEHTSNRELLKHISIAVQGVPDHDLHGNIVGYHGGIQSDVRWLKDTGKVGKGFSIRTRDKIVIGLIAAIPSLAFLVTVMLGG